MRRLIAVSAALALLAPAFAHAATAPASGLSVQLASKLLDFIDYKTQVRRNMQGSTLPPELVAVRPNWDPIFKQAMTEELDHDMPVIESMLGATLGKTFSDDEMKAGLKIVADPGLKAIYAAAQAGGSEPQGVAISKETDALMNTPAGASFVKKLQGIDTVLAPVQIEVMATVMPGVLRRFGEKADAAEIAKRSASGLASAK
jgi:hypothetical protein